MCTAPRLHIRSGQENSTINKLDLALNDLGNLGMLPLSDVLKVSFVLSREISSFALLSPAVLASLIVRLIARSLRLVWWLIESAIRG